MKQKNLKLTLQIMDYPLKLIHYNAIMIFFVPLAAFVSWVFQIESLLKNDGLIIPFPKYEERLSVV